MTRFSALGAVRFADRTGRRHGGRAAESPGGGLVSEDKTLPLNWSGGEGTGHHSPTLAYSALTYRAIMNAPRSSFQRADIPLDSLAGLSGTTRIPVGVGLNQMGTREPRH